MRNQKHIFVFGVCGRCSSTAIQRILNSSHQVNIWGEQHYLIDDLLALVNRLNYYLQDQNVKKDNFMFKESFNHKLHFFPYMNAMGHLEKFKEGLINSLCENLKPTRDDIKRVGFKDIRLKSINTLMGLLEIFPNSKFIFMFRNPLMQWTSVRVHRYWDYSSHPKKFLKEYVHISDILIDFSRLEKNVFFLEDIEIDMSSKMDNLLNFAEINGIDHEVIEQKYSVKGLNRTIDKNTESLIKSHKAYRNYLEMKSILPLKAK